MPIDGQASCAGLTISDAQGWLEWTCVERGGQAVAVSTGLTDGTGLTDLIDAAAGAWRANTIEVRDAQDAVAFTSASAPWWSAPVEVLTGSESFLDDGTVYVVAADLSARVSGVRDSGVSLVIAPGATLTAPSDDDAVVRFEDGEFLWIEGAIDGDAVDVGVQLTDVGCATVQDVTLTDVRAGLTFGGASGASRFARVSVDGASGLGFEATPTGDQPSTYADLSVVNGTRGGVAIEDDGARVERVAVSSSSTNAAVVFEGDGLTVTDVDVTDFDGAGVVITRVVGGTFDDLRVVRSGSRGVDVSGEGPTVTNVYVEDAAQSDSNGHAIVIGSTDGRFADLTALRTGGRGTGLLVSGTGGRASRNVIERVRVEGAEDGVIIGSGDGSPADNQVVDVVASRNRGNGIEVQGRRNVLARATTSQNEEDGVAVSGDGAILLQVLSAYNADRGVDVSQAEGVVYAAISAIGNGLEGLRFAGTSSSTGLFVLTALNERGLVFVDGRDNGVHNLYADTNLDEDVALGATATVAFQGNFVAGSCAVSMNGGGLDDDAGAACVLEAPSTAVVGPGIPFVLADLVGPIAVDDAVNASDTAGAGAPGSITDWTDFENPWRVWGIDVLTFPDLTGRGLCDGGETCRVTGLALAAGAVPARPPLPNGDATITHDWNMGSPSSQADCDGVAPGSVFAVDTCETRALTGAIEVPADGVGNDNGLCESGDSCLWMWHWGGYQGHGALASPGAFVDGAITGVLLLEYQSHGY